MKNYLKLAAIVLLMMCMLCCSVSCNDLDLGLGYRKSLDESLHNQIEVVFENQRPNKIVYQNTNYVYAGSNNSFRVITYKTDNGYYLSYKDDIMLSWNGNRYVWYIDEYYSDTSDNPIFIYEKRLNYLYFREDYDYREDTFVVEGFADEIVWNTILESKETEINFEPQIEVRMQSQKYPRIVIEVEIACIDNHWYLQLCGTSEVWSLSDEFVAILSKNKII